jgi:hypothetical protein
MFDDPTKAQHKEWMIVIGRRVWSRRFVRPTNVSVVKVSLSAAF